MKLKLLFTLLLVGYISFPVNAYNVETKLQKKNILLEEFTGIHCGNCPQGHAIVKSLTNAQAGVAYTIAIHTGSFASPGKDEPDFRTEAGDSMKDEFQVESYGYPSGTINRHKFNSPSIITGRASWTKDAKEIHSEDAPVNLWMKSEFDGATRKIAIKVEGYYTSASNDPFNLLNIALVENNIQGPQSGGGVGNEYIHNHMLRDFITPMWGDTIYEPTKEKYFAFEYSYLLPEEINGVEIRPEEIELILFVTTDKTDVLNVIGEKPAYKNFDKPLKATLYSHFRPIPLRYGYSFFEVMLKNESDKEITDANFLTSINGKEKQVSWNGTIASFQTMPIQVESRDTEYAEHNEYVITLTDLNGEKITESTLQGSFSAPIPTSAKIFLELQTDLYADENIVTIKDQNGNIVKEFGPYPSGQKEVYNEEIELDDNEIYCFEITDLWGDGIQQPKGYYKLYDENHTMFAQQYDIKQYGERVFFQTTGVSSINNNIILAPEVYINNQDATLYLKVKTFTEDLTFRIHDITGKKILEETIVPQSENNLIPIKNVSDWQKGIYLLTSTQNGKTETIKFVLH